MISRSLRCAAAGLLALILAPALAQQAPPPPPASATLQPQRTPGLSHELAEASRMIREGHYVSAVEKIDAALANDPKNPQARFLKGVVQSDENETDAAIATFQQLTEDYP